MPRKKKETQFFIVVHAQGPTRNDAIEAVEGALRHLRAGFNAGFQENGEHRFSIDSLEERI